MGVLFNIIKGFVFGFNVISVIIGFGTLAIDAVGVQHATPGTDGHAFFILGILLCGLLLMTTIVGCYGICSEILGVNVIYSIFMLSLLIIQYLQIRSFQPHGIYFHTLQDLEMAWRMVGADPKPMDDIQMRLHCCGLFNEQDYAFKHLPVPSSCRNEMSQQEIHHRGCLDAQWKSHMIFSRRQLFFNWALLVSEALTLLYSITLCILIKRRRSRNQQNRDVHVGAREVIQQNNVGSRHLLL